LEGDHQCAEYKDKTEFFAWEVEFGKTITGQCAKKKGTEDNNDREAKASG
jgi:hypothetical protein